MVENQPAGLGPCQFDDLIGLTMSAPLAFPSEPAISGLARISRAGGIVNEIEESELEEWAGLS